MHLFLDPLLVRVSGFSQGSAGGSTAELEVRLAVASRRVGLREAPLAAAPAAEHEGGGVALPAQLTGRPRFQTTRGAAEEAADEVVEQVPGVEHVDPGVAAAVEAGQEHGDDEGEGCETEARQGQGMAPGHPLPSGMSPRPQGQHGKPEPLQEGRVSVPQLGFRSVPRRSCVCRLSSCPRDPAMPAQGPLGCPKPRKGRGPWSFHGKERLWERAEPAAHSSPPAADLGQTPGFHLLGCGTATVPRPQSVPCSWLSPPLLPGCPHRQPGPV